MNTQIAVFGNGSPHQFQQAGTVRGKAFSKNT
jgi:hypothetical protein